MIATLLASYGLPELGHGDASNKTGRIFEEHDLRKTMHENYVNVLAMTQLGRFHVNERIRRLHMRAKGRFLSGIS